MSLAEAEQAVRAHPYWLDIRHGPPAPMESGKFWRVSRHADLLKVIRHPDVECADAYAGLMRVARRQGADITHFGNLIGGFFLARNAPFHTAVRPLYRAMVRHMTEASPRERVAAQMRAALDEIAHGGTVDATGDLCSPLPIKVASAALGLPEEVITRVRNIALDVLDEGLFPYLPIRAYADLERRAAELHRLVAREVFGGTPVPAIAELIAAGRGEAQLSDTDLINTFTTFIFAATHAIGASFSAALYLLAVHDGFDTLARRPELNRTAVDEVLRYSSVLSVLIQRVAVRDLEVGGSLIPAGTQMVCEVESGNFDPAAYADPNAFSIDRIGPVPLFFGSGAHVCLGANLGRMQLGLFLELVSRDYRCILEDTRPDWHMQLGVRRPARLPMRITTHRKGLSS